MTISAFTLLRDDDLRQKTAALAARLGFLTDSSLYRFLVNKYTAELSAVDAQIEAFSTVEDLTEEAGELVLDESLRSPFANSEYQHSEPAPADPEEPDPDILEWLEADEEDDDEAPEEDDEENPWLDEEEALRLLVEEEEALTEEATAAAFGERSPGELSRLVARVMVFLRSFEPARAELIRADIERQSSPDIVPAELFRAVFLASGLPFPLRE